MHWIKNQWAQGWNLSGSHLILRMHSIDLQALETIERRFDPGPCVFYQALIVLVQLSPSFYAEIHTLLAFNEL